MSLSTKNDTILCSFNTTTTSTPSSSSIASNGFRETTCITPPSSSLSSASSSSPSFNDFNDTTVPLKGEKCRHDDDDDHGDSIMRRVTVGFNEIVYVVFIPRRCDYPDDLRRTLFSNKKELSNNAKRNMIEYAFDNFTWKHCKEEHEMYINRNGERIHPVHLKTKIWSEREIIPPPGVQNLPKPRARRPKVPNRKRLHQQLHWQHLLLADDTVDMFDPLKRLPTPTLFLLKGI